VKNNLPPHGQIGILCITDKQFGNMELFIGKKEKEVTTPYQQLELF
jgi:CRISPR-associated protein Cas2